MTSKLDWIHLPPGAEAVSLWCCLHDARPLGARSDRLARTLEVDLDVFYIREHHALPDSFRFTLGLHGVQSARATRHVPWPGECPVPSGTSRDEESRLIAAYQAKWREDSMTWDDFEHVVSRAEHQILAASLVRGDETTLHLYCSPASDAATSHAHDVFVRAESISLVGSDGTDFGIDRFIGMGEAYWESFERRTK
jgi:hypothetical protein